MTAPLVYAPPPGNAQKPAKMPGPTKSQIHTAIAEKTGLTKKEVAAVFDALEAEIQKALKRGGEIVPLPGLVALKVKAKKAVPAGERMNPFTKEMKFYPAKAASKTVKATARKKLKDMV
jgi:nucleoid DNA-binding protein